LNNNSSKCKKCNILSELKNPFIYVCFLLIVLFFIPTTETYNLLKIISALFVIIYGLNLGAFRKRREIKDNNEITREQLEEVEKKLEEL